MVSFLRYKQQADDQTEIEKPNTYSDAYNFVIEKDI